MNFLKQCSRAITVHQHSWYPSNKYPFLLLPIIRSSLYSTSYHLNPPQITKIPRTRKTREPSSSSFPSTSSRKIKQEAQGFDWPRPNEIPYKAKVANLVNLTGHIKLPVKFQSFQDGKYRAITFISQEFGEKVFSIPVMFEGDLAHIVACHLKRNDSVHVKGQLSEDPIPFDMTENRSNYHVVVQDIQFVAGFDKKTVEGDIFPDGVVDGVLVRNAAINSFSDKQFGISANTDAFSAEEVDESVRDRWKEVMANPKEWHVITDQSDGGKPAFINTRKGRMLCIDACTSQWTVKKLDRYFDKGSVIDNPRSSHTMKNEEPEECIIDGPKSFHTKKDGESDLDSWRDLVKNSKQWLDFREMKSKGSLTPKFPDFKHKDAGTALWLPSAPKWVLSVLENLEFCVYVPKKNIGKHSKDEVWKSLVENPSVWWDNRLGKKNEKGPDFKHKKTGEVLWLNSSPDWVVSKLPPLRQKQTVDAA